MLQRLISNSISIFTLQCMSDGERAFKVLRLINCSCAFLQCDIMTNALQALQNQDGKWATKVMHSTKHFSASLLLNRV